MSSIFRNPMWFAGFCSGLAHAILLALLAYGFGRFDQLEFSTFSGGVALSVQMRESPPQEHEHWHIHAPGVTQDHQHSDIDSSSLVLHSHATSIHRQPALLPESKIAATPEHLQEPTRVEHALPPRTRAEEALPEITSTTQSSVVVAARPAVIPEELTLASPASAADAPGATVDSLPRAAPTNPAPTYPPESFARGEQGVVLLRVEVDALGQVTDARVAQSSGFAALDRSALVTVRRWKFSPARRDGRAVSVTVEVPVRFNLR